MTKMKMAKGFTVETLLLFATVKKAYQITDDNGKVISGGFCDSQGNINTTNTINGEQAIGCPLTKDQTREIHTTRKNNWAETQKNYERVAFKNLGKKSQSCRILLKLLKTS